MAGHGGRTPTRVLPAMCRPMLTAIPLPSIPIGHATLRPAMVRLITLTFSSERLG